MAVGFFDPQRGESPEGIARNRKLMESLIAGSSRAPRNVGEGLNAIGQALIYRQLLGETNAAEAAGRQGFDRQWAGIAAALGGGGDFPPAPPSAGGAAASEPMDYPSARVAQAFGDPVDISGSRQEFVNSLMPAALQASQRTGVDPRIIVAQAAQETGWGKSAPGNNYFGIKSHGMPGGQTFKTHEVIDGNRVAMNDSFRRFDSPADSVNGYADFLLKNPRYKPMMAAQGLDAQLEALGASGYATDPNYASSVGSIARGIQVPDNSMPGIESALAGQPGAAMPAAQIPVPATGFGQVDAPMAPGVPGGAVGAPQSRMAQSTPVAQNAPAMQPLPEMAGNAAPVEPGRGPTLEQILSAASNPYAPPEARGVLKVLLEQEMQRNDPARQMQLEQGRLGLEKSRLELDRLRNPQANIPDSVRALNLRAQQAGLQPGTKEYQDFMISGGRGAQVQVNVGEGSSEYNKALDKKFAEQYITIQDGAQQARNKLATLHGLGTALEQSGYTGTGAETLLAMKRAGRLLGLDMDENLGPQETARALGNQLALQLRSPSGGAGMPGAMSNKDREFLVASVPGLTKTPQGNARLIDFMSRIEQRNLDVANLAQQYADRNGQIDNGFYKELSAWSEANPLFPESGEQGALPNGATEDDIEFTMKKHGLTREQVLEKMNAR